jgi:hypothetical protein
MIGREAGRSAERIAGFVYQLVIVARCVPVSVRMMAS